MPAVNSESASEAKRRAAHAAELAKDLKKKAKRARRGEKEREHAEGLALANLEAIANDDELDSADRIAASRLLLEVSRGVAGWAPNPIARGGVLSTGAFSTGAH